MHKAKQTQTSGSLK